MRYILPVLLALALLPRALAQDKEAEKLFRAMEKKITEAKAFKVAVVIATKGDTKDRVGGYKGSLVLTKDNKARLKVSGVDCGEARRWEMVSNGKQVKLRPYAVSGVEGDKEEETLATPKHLHRHLATRVSRLGVLRNLPRLAAFVLVADRPGEIPDIRGLKAGAAGKVGGRDAKAVRYKISGVLPVDDDAVCTVWIDTKTLLPLKRVIVLDRRWPAITEIYKEFTLDPKTDARAFELTVGQADEAEKLAHAVEKKLKAASAVRATVNLELKAKGKSARGRATLLFTKENQARLKVDVDEFGKGTTAEMISDGKRIKYAESPDTVAKAAADPAPARLSTQLVRMLSGPGVYLTYQDVSGAAPFRGFKLVFFEAGDAEKGGGREAKVVTYAVAGLPGGDWNVTLWIDAGTGLPLKRVVTPIGGEPGSITETYTFTLKPKITAGAFKLPK
jgi:outer membrane lipoprotein-sorting protein